MSSESQDTPERVAQLVRAEIDAASYIPLLEVLAPFLVTPIERALFGWGADRPRVRCWVVADLGPEREGTTLVYCAGGQGAHADHWGIVKKTDDWVGRDDSWFSCLEDAAISAGIWHGALPAEYEIR